LVLSGSGHGKKKLSSIKTKLNYVEDRPFNGPCRYRRSHWFLGSEVERNARNHSRSHKIYQEFPISFPNLVARDVEIFDARDAKEQFTLEKNAFQLVEHSLVLDKSLLIHSFDFGVNSSDVERQFAESSTEFEAFFKETTGADSIIQFDAMIRSSDTPIKNGGRGIVPMIHTDATRERAEKELIRNMKITPMELQKKLQAGARFIWLNAWMNIADEPVQKDPLVVLDPASLISPDDFVPTDAYAGNQSPDDQSSDIIELYRLNYRHSNQHKWYYFSRMRKNEMLLFKNYDSDYKQSARFAFHSAFTDPSASPHAPPRESLEIRMFCWFNPTT
jgi:hypothetical protein